MLLFAAVLLLFPAYQKAPPSTTPSLQAEACHKFVQGFYDWYLPKMANGGMEQVFKHRPSFFTPALVRAFDEESVLQNRHPDLVGALDFDPFLDTQDPYDHYIVGDATVTGNNCLVNVYGAPGGNKNAKPDVVAEVVQVNGTLRFANFHYKDEKGKESDIIGMLRASKKEWMALETKEHRSRTKKPH